jgi:hypothetical protein
LVKKWERHREMYVLAVVLLVDLILNELEFNQPISLIYLGHWSTQPSSLYMDSALRISVNLHNTDSIM